MINFFKGRFKFRKILNCFGEFYMTRILLWRCRDGSQMMINIFHRSDEDRHLHDHPWNFRTFILWNGYLEHHPGGIFKARPLMTLQRPAQWRHRVQLRRTPAGKEKIAVTLVFTGPDVREWGYHTPDGWISHDDWWRKEGCS